MWALRDAGIYHHDNCWQVREAGNVTVLEYTPEGGDPGGGIDPVSERFRSCDQIDTSTSGGTIWRCEEGDL